MCDSVGTDSLKALTASFAGMRGVTWSRARGRENTTVHTYIQYSTPWKSLISVMYQFHPRSPHRSVKYALCMEYYYPGVLPTDVTGPGIAAPALLGIYISPALLNDVNVDVTYESNAVM